MENSTDVGSLAASPLLPASLKRTAFLEDSQEAKDNTRATIKTAGQLFWKMQDLLKEVGKSITVTQFDALSCCHYARYRLLVMGLSGVEDGDPNHTAVYLELGTILVHPLHLAITFLSTTQHKQHSLSSTTERV